MVDPSRPHKDGPRGGPSGGDESWWKRTWSTLRRAWHTEDHRLAILRDVLVAAAVVLLLLVSVWTYTGQPVNQAPLVVVESGSMMHGPYRQGSPAQPTGWGDPSFGRIGTIDPGDLVFVKDVDSLDDVETAFDSGRRGGYGGHGDVIVYSADGEDGTPIIHRAMLRVHDTSGGSCDVSGGACVFVVPESCDPGFADFIDPSFPGNNLEAGPQGRYCVGSAEPITGRLVREGLTLELRGYPGCGGPGDGRFHPSLVTKGDNNPTSDQGAEQGSCSGISGPVRAEWVIGKARGELPWFGLIKLGLWGNARYTPSTDPSGGGNWKIINATAPWDIWLCLFLALGIIVAAPIVIDLVRNKMTSDGKNDRGRPPG